MDSPLSHRELLAIAKEQLGLNESVHVRPSTFHTSLSGPMTGDFQESQVPAEYVEELRHHTQLYPDDTHVCIDNTWNPCMR